MEKDKQLLYSPLFLKYQADFEKNPRSRVFAPLAEIYRKIGMTDKAMEILSQGIRNHPAYVMGYMGLAFCYFDLKQFNLAYTTLRPFVEENRDNLRLQKLYADACLALFKKDEALETFKYLLFMNPRDKEVAAAVVLLEEEIEANHTVIHQPIVIAQEVFDEAPVIEINFATEKLGSSPKDDFDDWKTVNLKTNEIPDKEIIKTNWQVQAPIALHLETETEHRIDASNENTEEQDLEIEFQTENETLHTPVVTHTLVDLYCGQGHLEKALEILDKILILNPYDQRTLDKKNEILLLISPAENTDQYSEIELSSEALEDQEDDNDEIYLEENSISLEDEKIELTEEEGRQQLMDLIDEKVHLEVIDTKKRPDQAALQKKYHDFLAKIQKRALDYQSRI